MSTILKALRRLEEEKSRSVTSRPLREEVASGPRELPRRRLPWLPVAAMVVGAGLGASAWYVWPYERGGEPVREAKGDAAGAPQARFDAVTQAPVPTATTPPEAPVTRRLPPGFHEGANQIEGQLAQLADGAPAAGAPPEDAFASNVEVVQRPTPTPRLEPTPRGERPPDRVIPDPPGVAVEPPAAVARRSMPPTRVGAAAPAAAAPDAQVAPPEVPAAAPKPHPEPAPVAPKPRVESKPRVEPKPAPSAQSEPAPGRVAKASAPAAVSKSSAAASEVHVKRTQWHPEPARRSADLDVSGKSQSVHEGDVVDEYVVTEIRPSGVVLTRDGERVERSIGK